MAIRSMQSGKSPGPDGYPSDFFKKFSNQLNPLLKSTFEESFLSQSLPPTMRQAVISLILKKDKDHLDCGSYRPISLLNTDTKILAKVLARRLEKHLPSIISPDQTGFIKNRYSFFNIRRLLNIIYSHVKGTVLETVISLDAEKAFDRVRWDFLFHTLEKFGLGSNFVSWIKVLYCDPVAAIRTNNSLSPFFQLQRGTRQGCPLSPLLFAIAIEPLAIALRHCVEVEGIRRGDIEHKVSLYADDMLLFISNPSNSLPKLLDVLKEFGTISGYKVNFGKSEAMPLGTITGELSSIFAPFKLSYNKFKYLGIWITQNHRDLYKTNYLPLLSKLKEDFGKWESLPLSLGGRLNIIKMTIFPKFLYLFQCLPIFLTKSFFNNLNSQISSFIWNKKPPRLKQSVLQRPRSAGGLALPNFLFYYWAANIRALLYWMKDHDNLSSSWVTLERLSVSQSSLVSLLCARLPLARPISSFTTNPLVVHSLKLWYQLRRHFEQTELSLNAPPHRHCMFSPSLTDEAFNIWTKLGITSMAALFTDNIFSSFEQLVNKFKIPQSHFFRYLQLRNFVASNTDCFPSCPPPSLLDDIFDFKPNAKRVISDVYVLLSNFRLSTLQSLRERWGSDLGQRITDETWHKIINSISSSSICLKHVVIQFKVVHRLHWSKTRLSKIKDGFDPTCDRCRREPASLFHMFWACPKLGSFWKSIFETISNIFGVPIAPCPFIAIFGVTPCDASLSKSHSDLLAFCTLLARRMILLKWKEPLPPVYGQWVKDVMYYTQLEKIRYTVKGSVRRFYDTWQPFLTYFERLSPDTIA
uniref:Reverse transcriptase domain-containing protein n=1 Tax=Astatotilapia calliptera TaxID=8154 RepID=A0A3P8QX47_ASTCA